MLVGAYFYCPAVMVAFGSLFVSIYAVILVYFALAWYRNRHQSSSFSGLETVFISVVVPYRNEAVSLPALMEALAKQHLATDLFEVIAVNDHSEDGGREWLSRQTLFEGALRLVNAKEYGKKNALKEGILAAKGSLIVTVDADCIPHRGWLAAIMDGFGQNDADMLIGPVKMRSDGTFLGDFESIDYYALQMSGASSAMLGLPVFCSGANLAFKRVDWLEAVQMSAGADKASGDDVFLLHAFKKLHKKILFVSNPEAMVETVTSGSVAAFFRQRMRWGGKSTSYKDAATIALALIVFMANLWLLLLLGLWVFGGLSAWFFVAAFLVKAGADYSLLLQGRQFYGLSYSLPKHLCYSLVYPFVLVAMAVGGLLLPERWK
jgi:cellulose synthase/poly-beta-1,6-N-acetylglucosamine synthase-like glycosyltransferase